MNNKPYSPNTTLYDYQRGEITFISTADKFYHRAPDEHILQLLGKSFRNDGVIKENLLVALNRYIMRRDETFNPNGSKSKRNRLIRFSPALQLLLNNNEELIKQLSKLYQP